MAVLRLTQQNLKSIKRALWQELPDIRSGRLTEGIAAAAGFSTHASLLAALKSAGSDPVVRLDEALFSARLAEFDVKAPIGSISSVVRNRSGLPDPCWREASEKSGDQLKDWFHTCKRLSLPYVVVKPARKYSELEWDCITVDARYDDKVRNDRGAMARELFAVFQQNCVAETGRPMFQGAAFVGTIERLLPETSRAIADEFCVRLWEATRPERATD